MKIKVLGPGCMKCRKLYEATKNAIAETGVSAELNKVEQISDIMQYGVALTPALVIDGEVKCAGKLPSPSELSDWITSAAE